MDQSYHLICVNPFSQAGRQYFKGQLVSDLQEVQDLLTDRDHHFVKIPAPPLPVEEPEPEKKSAPAVTKK